ncbi:MmcQ/YjbR family DNA-binding protein [Shinella curvata]|uniref:MmcQ/YjbR family DNA-binding protein n=1 Tax=Shinella curvata TaxID=1817964 RepID=A0ABT8XGM1_9HYPH|nr:MmcQ/YjbR family DNA-binding protein [Shinella curvata]MCJ8053252.1 MmcQ/YjbR family DNA-binding protein [Shinella curvata]MDO6122583.1 MmcQ/YjbR family DNA-binding protein [Shinella curvata]
MSDNPLLARLQRLAEDLPGVETGTSYGTPALKVAGKLFVRIKDAETLVLMVPLDDKERLIEMAPELYYETDHYKGWPALLVRAAVIDDGELRHRLTESWRLKAPAKLRKLLD